MDVDVLIETTLPCGVNPSGVADLVRFALRACAGPDVESWGVTILLTDDERIRHLHRDFMGLDSPTDVMAFPRVADEFATEEVTTGGDIVVSVERAAAQAGEYGATPAGEVRFLIVHGLLHLCGWDDSTDELRAAMHERQAQILAAFERERGQV